MSTARTTAQPLVHVVDDDPDVVESVARVLDAGGLATETWTSATSFLDRARPRPQDCVILDVRMPEVSGPDVLDALRCAGIQCPVVFLTAHADVPTTVRAMKGGADDFLEKPVDPARLLEVLRLALRRGAVAAAATARTARMRERLESLTVREREVLVQLALGASNREVADRLGIAENTVKVHRQRIMDKLAAESLAEVVRLAVTLGLVPGHTEE